MNASSHSYSCSMSAYSSDYGMHPVDKDREFLRTLFTTLLWIYGVGFLLINAALGPL